MMNFSKMILARVGLAVALSAGLATSARADAIRFNPSGGAFTPTFTTSGLGFGPGSALAINAAPLTVGQTFQLVFQTHLTSLVGVNAVPGLNTTFQITEVGTFMEQVTSLTTTGGVTTATFALVPSANNRISIFENNAVVFNDAAGTGFNVGTEIARITPSSFTASQFSTPGTLAQFNQSGLGGNNSTTGLAVTGNGSTGINNVVNTTNPGFFVTQPLFTSIFNANISSVFDAVPPALLFTNPITSATIVPRIGAINGTSGPDIEFQVSGFTQSFSSVPEPASVAMTAIGLGGAGLFSVVARRRRARASA